MLLLKQVIGDFLNHKRYKAIDRMSKDNAYSTIDFGNIKLM